MKVRTMLLALASAGAMLAGPTALAPTAHAADNVVRSHTVIPCYKAGPTATRNVTFKYVWNDTAGSQSTLARAEVIQDRALDTTRSYLFYRPSPSSEWWVRMPPRWSPLGGTGHSHAYFVLPNIGEQIYQFKIGLTDTTGNECFSNLITEPDVG